MTDEDAFESAVRRVVREKNGGSIDASLFWDIVEALDRDLGRSDRASRARHDETIRLLSEHVADDKAERKTVAAELTGWQTTQAKRCAEEHRKLFARGPRRQSDPADVDFGLGNETRAEAKTARQKFSREQIVANFWILVALLALSGVVNGLIDALFKR
ncbi:MAG TPA: hypothetical protein DCQ64_18140 [Candidatus Rokubacteria bacterium]|nr:hypothetical protein [Candidatus Rokubacteria bacterium]